jgi:DNA-binding transcriptional regulator GbsR (MarR family)
MEAARSEPKSVHNTGRRLSVTPAHALPLDIGTSFAIYFQYVLKGAKLAGEHSEHFIESWGSLGVLWGINRSMARIHAFLLTSEEPMDLDRITEALQISRGNASMCLKELRNWGVIQRVHVAGDRHDYYVAEPEAMKMLFRIARERKRREFDPALHALRLLMAEGGTEQQEAVHARLTDFERLMTTIDRILTKCLEDEKMTRAVLNLLKSFIAK